MANEITSLIKYCDLETGLSILNSQTLRWSAPALFNDPFEPDHTVNPGVSQEALNSGLIKEALAMLFGPDEPTGKSNRLIAAIARWRNEDRFSSEEEAETVLSQLLTQVAEQQQESINDYLSLWRQFSNSVRICAFSDKAENLFAWQRYSANHNGIALRFECGQGTVLGEPRRVVYTATTPQVTSVKQQVNIAYGKETAPSADNFIALLLSKNKENSHEREWRCFAKETLEDGNDNASLYTDSAFPDNELKAVYLGLALNDEAKKNIINLVENKFPKTKILQAEAITGRYEIEFNLATSADTES